MGWMEIEISNEWVSQKYLSFRGIFEFGLENLWDFFSFGSTNQRGCKWVQPKYHLRKEVSGAPKKRTDFGSLNWSCPAPNLKELAVFWGDTLWSITAIKWRKHTLRNQSLMPRTQVQSTLLRNVESTFCLGENRATWKHFVAQPYQTNRR